MSSAMAPIVAEELIKWVSQVWIPQESLTDQETNFMSSVLRCVCETLRIKQLPVSMYHPQTDGLVERFNHTLKGIIQMCI